MMRFRWLGSVHGLVVSAVALAFVIGCGGQSAAPATSDAPAGESCSAGLSACGGACVNLQTTADHCGTCEHACASGALCTQGACVVPPMDCRRDGPCPRAHYCDIGDGTCKAGCAQDRDCGDHGACDTASRTCQCATGYHACAETCASNDSAATCGDRCAPCAAPDHAEAVCVNQSCGSTCQVGYQSNGGVCVLRHWTTGTHLPKERIEAATTTGNDGRIYVLGGSSLSESGAALVYTPSADRWDEIASPTPRSQAAAATGGDGRIYLIGGRFDGNALGTAEVYTPDTNSWASLPAMPTPRENVHAATGADGRIYVMGGDNVPTTTTLFKTVEVYSPQSNTWTTAAPMPTGRTDHAVVAVGGILYAIGGDAGGTMDAYDPASNTWSSRAPLRTPRGQFAAAVGPDGRIYVMGGFLMGPGSTEDPTGMTSVEVYTPATNSWATIAGMPTGRFELTAATGGDGRIYAMGGRDGFSGPRFSTVEIYQP